VPVLEVRRHSLVKDHVHLSQAGIDLARRVGASIGPFHRVVTSTITRTLETAVAMGFAVDEQLAVLGEIPPDVWNEVGHHERWGWDEPFVAFARLVRQGGPAARLGRAQAEAWRAIVGDLPEDGRALIISHGRVLEAGAVTCFPQADHASWGRRSARARDCNSPTSAMPGPRPSYCGSPGNRRRQRRGQPVDASDSYRECSADGTEPGESYAGGFFTEDLNGVRVFGHEGTIPGFPAWFDVYPSLDYTVIILTNFDATAARNVVWLVREDLTGASPPAPLTSA